MAEIQKYIRVGNVLTNIIDTQTGELVSYTKVTTKPDGTAIDDAFISATTPIYRKLITAEYGVEYFRKDNFGKIPIEQFGVKGSSARATASNIGFINTLADNNIGKIERAISVCTTLGLILELSQYYPSKSTIKINAGTRIHGGSLYGCGFIFLEGSSGLNIPYDNPPTATRNFELLDFSILSYISKSPNSLGLNLDTCTYGKIKGIGIENFALAFREKVIWNVDIDFIFIRANGKAWEIDGTSANTPGVPNIRKNVFLETNDEGIDLGGKGLNATLFEGGGFERCGNYAVKLSSSTNRTIEFSNINFEGNSYNDNGSDIIIGDNIGGPTNIKVTSCQFTDPRPSSAITPVKTAFTLIRGVDILVENCNFINYLTAAIINSTFGNYELIGNGGIANWADSSTATTKIPLSGHVIGNRNSWTVQTRAGLEIQISNSTTFPAKSLRLIADAFNRFELLHDGTLRFGSGSGATDLALARSGSQELAINGAPIFFRYFSQGNSDYTLTKENFITLTDNITANRTLTLENPATYWAQKRFLVINNNNNNSFNWQFASPISFPGNISSNIIPNRSRLILVSDGSAWTVLSVERGDMYPIIDTVINTSQTTTSLNTKYPNVLIGQSVHAPNLNGGTIYIKINNNATNGWQTITAPLV